MGCEHSRHDDLESLAYILIYFLCGSLPWYNAKKSTKRQCDKITQMKHDLLPNLLTEWPNKFSIFLDYTRALHFEDKPDYTYLRKLFRDLGICEGYQYDGVYDWCLLEMDLDDKGHQTPSSNVRTSGKAFKKEDDSVVNYSKKVCVTFFIIMDHAHF